MRTSTERPPECAERSLAPAGHWHLPLDGHGLVYFDEMVVQFRTLPKIDPAADPQVKRWAEAGQAAAAAKTEFDGAAKAAAEARISAEAPGLDAAALAQRNTDTMAKAAAEQAAARKLDVANVALAKAQSVVDAQTSAAIIILELIQRRAAGQALWSDVLIFESALLRLIPAEQLKARLWAMRQEYRDALGEPAYETLRDSLLDLKPDAPDPKKMLAEADNLLGDIHWHYTTTPRLEWQKTGLMLKLGIYLAVVAVLLLLLAWITKSDTVIWVLLSGAVGASISAAQRIQSTKARGNALLCIREAKWHTVSVGLAPMLGALFAFVLMLIFAGGIVSGAAFPTVRLAAKGSCTNLVTAIATNKTPSLAAGALADKLKSNVTTVGADESTNRSSATETENAVHPTARAFSSGRQEWCVAGGDLALLLLWAFIAGFSERLVPDLLTRISAKAQVKS